MSHLQMYCTIKKKNGRGSAEMSHLHFYRKIKKAGARGRGGGVLRCHTYKIVVS